ncbi:hypothetical protein CYY_000146 [Polysphondylium violaceum]|uniref:Peptidase A1 domain-containing protein n=1 Tax=Polysphondylium violaceum TaxID=133409 RepID=A0A8J4QBH6_9MYCE|nr:hypothetical protein CYY_000146 [Polysphondylium violaceum]
MERNSISLYRIYIYLVFFCILFSHHSLVESISPRSSHSDNNDNYYSYFDKALSLLNSIGGDDQHQQQQQQTFLDPIELKRNNREINFYHPETKELVFTSSTHASKSKNVNHVHSLINPHLQVIKEINDIQEQKSTEQQQQQHKYKEKILINNDNDRKVYKHLLLDNHVYFTNEKTDYYSLNVYNKEELINSDSSSSTFNFNNNSSSSNVNSGSQSSTSYSAQDINRGQNMLYGGITSSFEYFIPILIGNPPQMFTVQIDTGSTSLAVPGSDCFLYKSPSAKTSCSCSTGHYDGLYNINESISAYSINCTESQCMKTCTSDGKCSFILKYGDGSFISGSLVTDTVSIGSFSVNAKFGNIQKESLSFSQLSCPPSPKLQAVRDGIFGLAYQALDPNNGDDIFGKIVKKYNIPNLFSMCLGNNGGLLLLGGVEESLHLSAPRYAKITTTFYYSISVSNVLINGETLPLTPSSFRTSIVDSGTTLLYFNDDIFYTMVKHLSTNFCSLPGFCSDFFWERSCHLLSEDELKLYPTISIEITDTEGKPFQLDIPPSLYLLNISNLYCFGISHMKEISVLIGDVVLQGYNVIYDRAHSRVGFAPIKTCNPSTVFDNLVLSIENGSGQKTQEGEAFDRPLVVSLISKTTNQPVKGVIVSFTVTAGNAYFYPSFMSSIRNISDENGIVTMNLTPKSFGKITVEVSVWGTNSNGNTVHFNLNSQMKSWKIILISISAFIATVIIVVIGVIIYKRSQIRKSLININRANSRDIEKSSSTYIYEKLANEKDNNGNNEDNEEDGIDVHDNSSSSINNNSKNNNEDS